MARLPAESEFAVNCKQGDLAIVVKCKNAPENIGAIRTCVAIDDDGWGNVGWELDRDLPNGDNCICDTCLRPLRAPPDLVDIEIDIPDYSDLHLEPTP
jgi:hypothetical protein